MESILLSTIRRIYSKFRFPAGCLLYALVAFGLWYYGTHSTGPSDFRQGKWEKIELPFERDIASTSISPDGSRFAIIKFDSFAHSKGYFLELHNVNTSSVDRTLWVPTLRPWGIRASYCDYGKYIAVGIDTDKLYSFDANTFAEKSIIQVDDGQNDSAVTNFVEGPTSQPFSKGYSAFACSADSDIVGIQYAAGPKFWGVTRFYHLETGKPASQQVTEEQNMYGSELSISPRGAAAVILRGHGIEEDSDGFVLDVPAGRIIQTLKTGIYPMAAAFVGEGHIALASKIPKLCCIEVIDAHDGHITQQFGDPETGSRDAVGVSADGKVLFAFSAAEWRYKNALQVRTPHIDVWDTTSGKLIARSPEIEMMKNAGAMLDFSYTDTILPSFELCSRANAILVTWPGRNRASVIYRWK